MIKKWTWEMIADTLIKEFQNDKYVKGEKMPSENKMAVRFQVPRSEIRKAYERLKELGYVYSMQGYGSFFSGKQEKIRLSMNDESFSKKMRETGINFETRNVGCRRISGDSLIHTMLGVDFGELAASGLTYTVSDSGLIGVAHTPAYDHVSVETNVLAGATFFPEVKDYIVKGTITTK